MIPELRTSYPNSKKVADVPGVYEIDGILSDQECNHLISMAYPHMKRAFVSAEKEGVTSDGRTGSVYWVPHHKDKITSTLSQRIAAYVGLPLENAESIQVIHYGETQQYKPHFDAWDLTTDVGKRCTAKGGQRLVTCLIYLNNVADGGGTNFPKLKLQVGARKGKMVLFHNCHPKTNTRHPHSLHGGMPVKRGEKWACNFWFRERPYK
ncbi:MAG: 2OG-Fe(II) oxygenase [Kangiellaceae bacterium]|jgi:prolyl 4-hydroxylase|nr:2OG-Fe(II) oxygenase [Kangiellaceae bacterium]|tara:strand:- start:347 stop:970 length:624 start_codon:yes stop_codon:yes gene_type:complete